MRPTTQDPTPRRGRSPREVARRNGVGHNAIYEEIRRGNLIAHKIGSRTVIFDEDEERWKQSLPRLELIQV